MAIGNLDQAACNGCGICARACPEDVLHVTKHGKKAYVRYPEDCVACRACVVFCPQDCIEVKPGSNWKLPTAV